MVLKKNCRLRVLNANPVLSFVNLRRLIGILGMATPLICYIGGLFFQGLPLQSSISAYYYTNVRDIFVGIMSSVGIFMISYRGYEHIDDLISSLTAACSFGIAVFPCALSTVSNSRVGFFQLQLPVSNILHGLFSAGFFLLLAVNSIFLFTLSDKTKEKTRRKKIRNAIYIICGIVILIALAGIGLLNFLYTPAELDTKIILFILETILLESFGISWLIKGRTLLRDSTKTK
jgi:uncharacterized membrane protein YiaA